MSRYLSQLLYFFGEKNLKHELKIYNAQRFTPEPISVAKDDRILKLLDKFREGGPQNLSASAINTYIGCSLNFYLQYVEGYRADDEITDYMDASTYGTIVHNVAQKLYQSFQPTPDRPVEITSDMLGQYLKTGDTALERMITREINSVFNKLDGENALQPLLGETLVIGKVIHAALKAMLKVDMELCPFTFVSAEKEEHQPLKINDDLTINLRMFIDRIDRVNGQLRFIDYKTGGDKMSASSVDSFFNTNLSDRPKAIMQLMMYCHAYNTFHGTDEPIQPLIYKILDITAKGVEPLRINRSPISDYHEFKEEFVEALYRKIAEIFDPETQFTQTAAEHNCRFCQFKSLCGRE